MIKALKVGIEGMYFNIIKFIHVKPRANIIFNGERLKESLSSKIGNKTRGFELETGGSAFCHTLMV